MQKLFVFGLLFCTMSVFGQGVFTPGYVVLNSGDTLNGLVMDEQWLYAPDQVNFKESETSTPRTFNARELKAVSSPYDTYERYVVAYDPDDLRAKNLPRTRDPKWVTDTLLLKLLYKSKYSLYKTTTNNGRLHFFLAADTSKTSAPVIEELLYREWIVATGSEMMMINERWKQQLINMTFSCGEQLNNQIKIGRYNEKDLTKLIAAINVCKGGPAYDKPAPPELPRKKGRFGIVGSAFYYHLQTRAGRSPFDKLHPAFGVSYEHFSRRWPNKLAYYHELKYSSLEQSGKTDDYAIPANYSVQAVRLISFLRRYTQGERASFFVNGGISLGVPIKSRGRIPETQFTAPIVFSKFEKVRLEQGFAFGLGVKLFPSAPVSVTLETRYQVEAALFSKSEFRDAKAVSFLAALQF